MPLFRKRSMESFVSPSTEIFEEDAQSPGRFRHFSLRQSRRFPDIPDICVRRDMFVDVRRKGLSWRAWSRLHLRMTMHTLSLHKKKDSEPLEIIVFQKVVRVQRVENVRHCLQIDTTEGKVYQIDFYRDDDLYSWLTDIQKIVSPIGKPTNFKHPINVREDKDDKTRLIGLPEGWHHEWQNMISSPSSGIHDQYESVLPEVILDEPMIGLDPSLSFLCFESLDLHGALNEDFDCITKTPQIPRGAAPPQIVTPPSLHRRSHIKSEKRPLRIITQDHSMLSVTQKAPFSSTLQDFPPTPHLSPDRSPATPGCSPATSSCSSATQSWSSATPSATSEISPLTPFRESPYRYRVSDAQNLTGQIRKLGTWPDAHGGYADIWRAQWITDGVSCTVAVKVLRVTSKDECVLGKIRRRLANEVRVWHQLRHKNVVPMYGTCDGFNLEFTSMVSAWYDNGNINTYLRKLGEEGTVEMRLKLLTEVATGLNYLHTFDCPVVHGDLKGANILVNDDGEAALADFGLSSILESMEDSGTTTFTGGSVRWMAPEILQLSSHQSSAKTCASDTYSYGSVILEVMTGKMPYRDISSDLQVITQLSQGIKPKRPRRLAVNHGVWELMERCWNTIPTERPHIAVVLLRMEEFLAEQRKSVLP